MRPIGNDRTAWARTNATAAGVTGLAYSRWIRPVGIVAPLSMAIYSASWLALFYGSEASPNYYVAACAVGLAGSLVSYLQSSRVADLVWVFGFLSAASLLRPIDGVVLAALAALVVMFRQPVRLALKTWAILGFAVLLGLTPWILESYNSFDGPFTRLRLASEVIDSSWTFNLAAHLRLMNGPLVGPENHPVSLVVLVLVLAVVVVGSIGVLASPKKLPILVAAGFSVGVVTPYIVYVGALAPRFLLPGYALWSIPLASGSILLWNRGILTRTVITGLGVAAISWSLVTAVHIESLRVEARELAVIIADTVRDDADGQPCTVLSHLGHPPIAFYSGCNGARATNKTVACVYRKLSETTEDGEVVYFATRGLPDPELLPYLVPVPLPSSGSRRLVFRIDPGLASTCA